MDARNSHSVIINAFVLSSTQIIIKASLQIVLQFYFSPLLPTMLPCKDFASKINSIWEKVKKK